MKRGTRYRDLKDYRSKTKTRQEDMAAALGITQSLLSMIESRQRTPKLPLALEISRRYGVPLESLIAIGDEWKGSE